VPTFHENSHSPEQRAPADGPQSYPSWTLPQELREFEEDGDRTFLAGLIASFLADSQDRVQRLRQAAVCADFSTLWKQFHALKGSAGAMGVREVSDLCREAEEQATSGIDADYARTVARIESAFLRVRPALMAYCAQATRGSHQGTSASEASGSRG